MNESDFRELLRFADIPATWRNWLTQIAYRTLTRVDIRRMHAMGVLSDADLVKAYTDFGYNTANAEAMAEFTILYNMEEDRALTKTDILKGYRLGVLTRGEAQSALVAINYSPDTASYFLDTEDYKLAEELADEEISVVRDLYIAGALDKSEATARLNAVGLTSGRVAHLFELWDIRRAAKTRRPTKADLEQFVKQELIPSNTYQSEMGNLGYEALYVQWYYASIVLDQEDAARKEEERAAKEAERIADLEVKTAYQEAKAQLDFQIAQERLHYQQIKTAITLYARREEVDELMATIEELQRDIASIDLDIAGKRTMVEEAQVAIREYRVPPDLARLYAEIDGYNLQITGRESVIADLRVTIAEGMAAIRVARIPAEFTELADSISEAQAQIAVQQASIADLRVQVAQARLEITRLDIPTEVQTLYGVVDQARIDVAGQQAEIGNLQVALAEAEIETHWLEPAAEVEAQRRIIDALNVDIREEQESIASIKLEIAEIKAQVERMMSSEEIAELEAELAATQEQIRQLEVERARLRLA